MGPQLGPLEIEYPETRFLSGFVDSGSIRGLRSAPVVAVPMSPGHRATSRALSKGSSERMVLFLSIARKSSVFNGLRLSYVGKAHSNLLVDNFLFFAKDVTYVLTT